MKISRVQPPPPPTPEYQITMTVHEADVIRMYLVRCGFGVSDVMKDLYVNLCGALGVSA